MNDYSGTVAPRKLTKNDIYRELMVTKDALHTAHLEIERLKVQRVADRLGAAPVVEGLDALVLYGAGAAARDYCAMFGVKSVTQDELRRWVTAACPGP